MRLYYCDTYAAAGYHYDTTRKAAWIAESLASVPVSGVELIAPASLGIAQLAAVHDPEYVETIRTGQPANLAASSGLPWDSGLWSAVCASTGGTVAAARHALLTRSNAGSLRSGLHHARRASGAGFCVFNGLALAARAAIEAGARRVLILDLDAHLGGGTMSLIGDWPEVWHTDITVSPGFDGYQVHGHSPATLDVVTDAADYLVVLQRRLAECSAARFDLVLYNAGVDVHQDSDIGGLDGVDARLLRERDQEVFAWAEHLGVPVAFVLAGGYASNQLSQMELVALHRQTIEAAALSDLL